MPRALPGGRYSLPGYANTIYGGFYVYDMELDRESGKEPLRLPFAVNVDPAEGDLQYPSRAEAQAAIGIERVLDSLPAIATENDSSNRSELGPSLLLLTLLLVLGEATLARFVAARRT